jgi:hypothetical protein
MWLGMESRMIVPAEKEANNPAGEEKEEEEQ